MKKKILISCLVGMFLLATTSSSLVIFNAQSAKIIGRKVSKADRFYAPSTSNLEIGDSSNKWAILCIGASEPYEDYDGQLKPSSWMYEDYVKLRGFLVNNLGFPSDHIFDLVNESFTVNSIKNSFVSIKEQSNDWETATIVFVIDSHGYARRFHSYSTIYSENAGPPGPEGYHDPGCLELISDTDLKNILDNYTLTTQKVLVTINSCESWYYTGLDTLGIFQGLTDFLFKGSCGEENRIIITGRVVFEFFWKEGLIGNNGDLNSEFGNHDGITSVEEAWFYYRTHPEIKWNAPPFKFHYIPCMNDQYPGEMFL